MIYYLSNNGNDSNNGNSIDSPFKTIARINNVIRANDTILIERNSIYREKLKTYEGCRVDSYGSGDKPIFDFATILEDMSIIVQDGEVCKIDLSNVSKFSGYIDTTTIDNVGFIIVNGNIYSFKKMSFDLLENKFDFYSSNKTLYIKCLKSEIESLSFASRQNMLDIYKGMTVSNIKFMNTGGHGMSFRCDDVMIESCDFENIGGSKLDYDGKRFGNGVEIWTEGRNIDVKKCSFNNIYDTATTIQGNNESTVQYFYENINIHHNTIQNCGQSFECWVKGAPESIIRNCSFSDNICIKTAKGSIPISRPNPYTNCHILFYETNIYDEDIKVKIKNNIFEIDEYPVYFFRNNPKYENVDQNLIIGYANSLIKNDSNMTLKNKNEFIETYNYDRNSKFIEKTDNTDLNGLINRFLIEGYKQSKIFNQLINLNGKILENRNLKTNEIVIPEVRINGDCWRKFATIKTYNANAKCTLLMNYSLVDDEVFCGDSGILKIHIAFASLNQQNKSGLYFSSYFTNSYIKTNDCFQIVYNETGNGEGTFDIFYKASCKIYAKLKLKLIDSYFSRNNIKFNFNLGESVTSLEGLGTIIEGTFI